MLLKMQESIERHKDCQLEQRLFLPYHSLHWVSESPFKPLTILLLHDDAIRPIWMELVRWKMPIWMKQVMAI